MSLRNLLNLENLNSDKENKEYILQEGDRKYYLSAGEYNTLVKAVKALVENYEVGSGPNGQSINIIKTGDLTPATDSNVLSALRTLSEIQKIDTDLSSKYLSKQNDDIAKGKIIFENGVEFGNYFQGSGLGDSGSGAKITQGGHAEFDSLLIRNWLEVPLLKYNKTEITSGDSWRGPGGGIIKSVNGNIIELKLEEGEYGELEINDLCTGIFHSLIPSNNESETQDFGNNHRTIKGFATSYFKIVEQLNPQENNSLFRYEVRSATDPEWIKDVHPEPQMTFSVFGNTLNTNRQQSVYESREYTRFLSNMNTWKSNFNNVALQIGKLNNLGSQFSDYSLYVKNIYMSGSLETLKLPFIGDDGYWYEYDFDLGDYVKTDRRAEGGNVIINPIKYSLIPSSQAIEKQGSGVFSPDFISCYLQEAKTNIKGETIYKNLTELPNGLSCEIRTNENGVLSPYVPGENIQINNDIQSIEFHLKQGNVLLDKQVIPIRESSGLTFQVNPQTILCEVDSEGNVLNWSGTKVITCELIQGLNEQLTPTLSVSFPQSVSYTISGNQVIITNITKIDGVSTTGIITATATFNGTSVSRKATIQFTTTGKGENAVIHSIHPDPERVKIFKDGTYEMNYAECYIVRYDGKSENRLQNIPNNYIVKYNFRYNDGSESQQEEYLNPVYIPNEVSRITYKLYKRTNTNLHISEASTLIIPVGNDGNDGNNGNDGWSNAQIRLEIRSDEKPTVPQNNLTYNFRTTKLTGNLNNWVYGVAPFEKKTKWVTYALASSQTETDIIEPTEWSEPIEDTADVISREIYLYKRAPVNSPPTKPSSTLMYNFETMVLSGNLNGWSQTPEYVQGLAQWRTHAMAVTSGNIDDIEPSEWATPYIHAQDGQDGEGSVVVDATSETLTIIVNGDNEITGGNEQIVTYGMLFGNDDLQITGIEMVNSITGINPSLISNGFKKGIKFTLSSPPVWLTNEVLTNKMLTFDIKVTGIKNGTSINKIRTITFIIQKELVGTTGKDATIYSLYTSEDVLLLDEDNNWIGPNSIEIKVKRTKGDLTTLLQGNYNDLENLEHTDGYWVRVTKDNQTPYNYNWVPLSVSKDTNKIKLELVKNQLVIDSQIIPIIKQSKDGDDGISINLTRSEVLVANNNYSGTSVSVEVRAGAQFLLGVNTTTDFNKNSNVFRVEVTERVGVTGGNMTSGKTLGNILDITGSDETGYITLAIHVKTTKVIGTFSKTISYKKINNGTDGTDGTDGKDGKDAHSPYINGITNTWWTWDDDIQDWVDSGVKAEGEDGKDGKDGLDGLGSWTLVLSNDFTVIKVSDQNVIKSGLPAETKVKLYYGIDEYPISNVNIISDEVLNSDYNLQTQTVKIHELKDGIDSEKEVVDIILQVEAEKDNKTTILEKTFTIAKLRDGEEGPAGISVPLVFRGEWVEGDIHFGTENRRDLVKVTTSSTASYFMSNSSLPPEGLIASNSNKPGTPGGNNYWIPFDGSYQSIATGLLLAEKANIGGFAFSGQTKASKVPANSIISQFGVDWDSKASINLSDHQTIVNQFLPNLTLNGEYGYIQMRDSVLLNSDGSGYVANNNFKWDQLGNINIGPLNSGMYYDEDDPDGKRMWVEFSKEGYSYWHFPHTSEDRYLRVKIQGGHWSEPHLFNIDINHNLDMTKVHYKYEFCITDDRNLMMLNFNENIIWSQNISFIDIGQYLWFRRSLYNPDLQTYDSSETPCLITPAGGHKINYLNPIYFNANDGSGWLANNNLNWNSIGDLTVGNSFFKSDGSGHLANNKLNWTNNGILRVNGLLQLSTSYSGNLASSNIFWLPPIQQNNSSYAMPINRDSKGKIIKFYNSSKIGKGSYIIRLPFIGISGEEGNSTIDYTLYDEDLGLESYSVIIPPMSTVEVTCFELPPGTYKSTGSMQRYYSLVLKWEITSKFTPEDWMTETPEVTPTMYYNVLQNVQVFASNSNCNKSPYFYPVTHHITIPSGITYSTISQEDANNKAQILGQSEIDQYLWRNPGSSCSDMYDDHVYLTYPVV